MFACAALEDNRGRVGVGGHTTHRSPGFTVMGGG